MCSILRCFLLKQRGYASIQGYQSPTRFNQDPQIWHHTRSTYFHWCPHCQPLQPRKIIHCKTRLSTQLWLWLHWLHSSSSKTMQWWHNSNANRLRHWLLSHRWIHPTKFSAPPFPNGMGCPWKKHYSSHKLRLTSPRHNMQVSNIGI